jgi:phage terminase large subunit-like protein
MGEKRKQEDKPANILPYEKRPAGSCYQVSQTRTNLRDGAYM